MATLNRGLRQINVVKAIGTTKNVYLNLETGKVDPIESTMADKLIAFYKVDENPLLDEYNRFLHCRQGNAILQLRIPKE